ncbi:family A1 protease [Daedaleopsis nitida]|nr:family A1 protease [Daedaleopsis nitida]
MFARLRLACTVLLAFAFCADALHIRRDSVPVTLPFVRRVNMTGTAKLLEIDQARAKALKTRESKNSGVLQKNAVINVPITNQAVSYVATVSLNILKLKQDFDLIVDTGSSNTWVGARLTNLFLPPLNGPTGDVVSVTYGSGSFIGIEVVGDVTMGNLTVKDQSFGVAAESMGFQGVDGILGLGPADLTEGTLTGKATEKIIPTVTDNAASQGSISQNLVAVSFEPTTTVDNINGELTFGGTDPSKFTGSIHFAPVTTTQPASLFWGIDQSITYGSPAGQTTVLPNTAGIVDTGTTLLLIASDAFSVYRMATGAVPDASTGLLRLTPAQFASLQSLFFTINGVTFELTANAQIWPRALNSEIGGDANHVYLIVNDIGSSSGEGLDFINGQTFLERFYSVFDTTNRRVGLATTPFTHATTN